MSWHGLDAEQYEKLYHHNCGRCWLCSKPYSRSRPMAVDHRHRDGLVRGGICAPCNVRLGEQHEDIGWFTNAIRYLTYPPAIRAIGRHYIPDSPGAAK